MAKTSMLLVALAVAGAEAALAQSQHGSQESYSFHDQVTGLMIALPQAWERRDPGTVERTMADSVEGFRERQATDDAKRGGLIFLALARPYDGPEKTRPTLSCMARPAPPDPEFAPQDVKQYLERAVESTFGRYEPDVTITPARRRDVGAVEAYRLTVSKEGAAPWGGTFIMLLKEGWFVQCFGMHDARWQASVERALDSIGFE